MAYPLIERVAIANKTPKCQDTKTVLFCVLLQKKEYA